MRGRTADASACTARLLAAAPAGGGAARAHRRQRRAGGAVARDRAADASACAGRHRGGERRFLRSARVGVRWGQRRRVGPLTRRLAGAAALLCSACVWAGTLTCRLALRARWRRRWQGGAGAQGRAADASALAARSPAVALAGGGAALASLGSRQGQAAHALGTADDGDGETGDDNDGDGVTATAQWGRRRWTMLELSPKGTYVMYPYHESLEDRVISHARYIRYPITTNTHM